WQPMPPAATLSAPGNRDGRPGPFRCAGLLTAASSAWAILATTARPLRTRGQGFFVRIHLRSGWSVVILLGGEWGGTGAGRHARQRRPARRPTPSSDPRSRRAGTPLLPPIRDALRRPLAGRERRAS